MKKYFLSAVLFLMIFVGKAQNAPVNRGLESLTPEFIQAQLEFLSSDWLEGREAGERGGYMAGDYIRSLFKMSGTKPFGDPDVFTPNRYQKLLGAKENHFTSYFQPFFVTEIKPSTNHQLWIKYNDNDRTISYNCQTDFAVVPLETSISLNAPVVFVGYGLTDKSSGYDDFAGIQVKGKIIVRLAGFPGQHDTTSVAWQNFKKLDKSTLIEKKNELAQKLGAVAILEFDPSVLSKKLAANVPFRFNEAMYEGDSRPESFYDRRMVLPGMKKNQIPLISVSEKVFNEFLSPSGLSYAKFEGTAAQLKQNSFDLKKINAGFNLTANTRALQLRNVLGIIEGEKPDEFIVVGGHYDHLGKHNGFIWNGADDNGSGAIAVTSIAKAFNETGMKPKRSIIFACWDGEERGELGSSYFVDHFNKIGQVKAYLNFDMIGRNSGPDAPNNQVALLYSKSAEYLADLTREQLKQANINLNINYSPMENPAGGSDNTAFALKNVPMFWYHTGGHTDYHQASDHAELINWAKMTDIIKLSFLSVWKLSNE